MHLSSIIVRNYRLHRELKIELDRSLSLIGGPNESGKSTLAEAAHRALFLRAKGTSEAHKSMIPRTQAGHPEVELVFEAGGRSYRLHKRFSGASGTASLTQVGGASWTGDEAETKLAELLGVEAVAAGRGAAGRVAEQWAHIWIQQGQSGKNPVEATNAHRDSLFAQLQGRNGAAAAIQSELDARVAGEIARRLESTFTRGDLPKAGSELARATAEQTRTAEALEAARQTHARLERAVQDVRDADHVICSAETALGNLRQQAAAVEERLALVAALSADEKQLAQTSSLASGRHDALIEADGRIHATRKQADQLTQSLAPDEKAAQVLAEEEAASRQQNATAEQAAQQATVRAQRARLSSALAVDHVTYFERVRQRDDLAGRLKQVHEQRAMLANLDKQLAQVPAIAPARLRSLHKLDTEAANAAAALDAMAAGLEIIASDLPVRVAGRDLSPGDSHVLTEDTEIIVGGTRLRIRPGGGTSLADARRRLLEANSALAEALGAYGLKTVAEAVEASARRQQLESDLNAAQARLDALGNDTIDTEFERLEKSCAEMEADLLRRGSALDGFSAPATLAAAQALRGDTADQLQTAEGDEAVTRAQREETAAIVRRIGERLATARRDLQERERELTGLRAQLHLLLETHGDDARRAAELAELSTAREAVKTALAETRRKIADLQPTTLESDRARLKRAVEQQTAAKSDAEQKRAAARADLRRDGTTDPQADLALAENAAHTASERLALAQRKGTALQLLHDLFLREQKDLADQFTRPLAATITAYLECLFGPGARAEVGLENNEFAALRLVRAAQGDAAFDFDALSGGTREQLAAAVRLAVAEVLAAAHDRCLPLVFDDAFAYSDPERVQTLQRMLDLAATRGLQIIVLTCTPADYAALGARTILLQREPLPGTVDRKE
jgi:DNA repair exonuclease SbcCD ATPase subunit